MSALIKDPEPQTFCREPWTHRWWAAACCCSSRWFCCWGERPGWWSRTPQRAGAPAGPGPAAPSPNVPRTPWLCSEEGRSRRRRRRRRKEEGHRKGKWTGDVKEGVRPLQMKLWHSSCSPAARLRTQTDLLIPCSHASSCTQQEVNDWQRGCWATPSKKSSFCRCSGKHLQQRIHLQLCAAEHSFQRKWVCACQQIQNVDLNLIYL